MNRRPPRSPLFPYTTLSRSIELPIATEHNRQIDYHAAAVKQGVRSYFTPVVGNEVTTTVGHFNVFPMRSDGPVPDFKLRDRKSTRLNSSHLVISYAVFCLKK